MLIDIHPNDSMLMIDLKMLQACDINNWGHRVKEGKIKYAGFGDILVQEGKPWTPGWQLKETEYAKARQYCRRKQCYRNCFMLAALYRELTYCEGRAVYPNSFSLPHAFLLDPEGRVIEATWDQLGREYYGIPFQTEFLNDMSEETGYAGGIFENPQSPVVTGEILLEDVRKEIPWVK